MQKIPLWAFYRGNAHMQLGEVCCEWRGLSCLKVCRGLLVLGESIGGGVMDRESEMRRLREHVKGCKAGSMFWNNRKLKGEMMGKRGQWAGIS